MDDVDNPKRTAAQRPEQRHASHRPQDELQVEILADMRAIVRLADSHRKHRVGHHPRDDHVRAHGAVVVFLLLGLADAGLDHFEAVAEVAQGFVVAGVDVELLAGHLELDGVALADGGAEVDVDDVVAFGAPGDVVGVAEGVDLQGADVGGEEGEVLRRGGEHVPGVEVEEGHEEVEADGGSGGDDEVGEDVVAEFEGGVGGSELGDDDVEGGEGGVGHYDGVDDYAGHEHSFRAEDRLAGSGKGRGLGLAYP